MPHPSVVCVVRHPTNGMPVALDPAVDYQDDDPLVTEYAWAFAPLENAGKIVDSVSIEDTSAAPGRKRHVTVKK